MKIGIISFAHMHAFSYASCLQKIDGVELAAISDEDSERGNHVSEQLGVPYYQNYHDLLNTDIDAVIICTENAKHAEVTIAAANAKKHILCEKPLATNMEDGWRMIEACKTNQVKLQTAFPVRFNPPVKRVKQMIDNGDLGRVIAIRGTNRGTMPGGWFVDAELSGGGAVLDHTVHVIDLMRWFMNSEVKEVYAEIDTRFHDVAIDDCGLLTIEFENGVFASHDPSWSRCETFPTWGDVTLEIIGTHGVTKLDAFAQHMMLYSDKQNKVSEQFWGNDFDLGLIEDFVACIREDRVPSITGEDGLRAMEVALAAYQSAQEKKPFLINRY